MRKKKDNSEIEPKEKKSRAEYQCPKQLKKFIEDVSQIVSHTVLPKYKTIYKKHPYNPPSNMLPEERQALLNKNYEEIFNECFEPFSEEFKQNHLQNVFSDNEKEMLGKHPNLDRNELLWLIYDMTISRNYIYYQNIHYILRKIAVFFSHLRKNDYQSVTDSELKTINGETVALPAIRVQIVRNGTKGNAQREVSEAFIGVHLDRIRACEICGRIFWAKYKNSETCSTLCLNALRQRRHRKTNKEAINEKRRANYRRNKKLKQLRGKNNDTT